MNDIIAELETAETLNLILWDMMEDLIEKVFHSAFNMTFSARAGHVELEMR